MEKTFADLGLAPELLQAVRNHQIALRIDMQKLRGVEIEAKELQECQNPLRRGSFEKSHLA